MMNLYCNNCGKHGHQFNQCKSPITSHGIIVFRENPFKNNVREYLLIRRKDTLGYVDFMRGKYSIYNKKYILNMIKQMTNAEKHRLITEPFSKLWNDLWVTTIPQKRSVNESDVPKSFFSNKNHQVIIDNGKLTYYDKSYQTNNSKTSDNLEISKFQNRTLHFSPDTNSGILEMQECIGEESSSRINSLDSFDNIDDIQKPFITKSIAPLRKLIPQSTSQSSFISAHEGGYFNIHKCNTFTNNQKSPKLSYHNNSGSNSTETLNETYKAEEINSKNKFESLKSGIYTKTDFYNLEELIEMTKQTWTEPEWGFPKGRRNYQEKDYDCAVREFCEETGYNIDKLIPLKNIQPFEEIFTGSNYKSYKHKYYVHYMNFEDTLSFRNLQVCEVSKSSWLSIERCYELIRDYNIEKKKVLSSVEKMLSENHLHYVYH